METFLTVLAAPAMRSLPMRVEPVKAILRTSSLLISSSPMDLASPTTTLSTPSGMPARSPSSAIASAVSGVSSLGFSTTWAIVGGVASV